MWIPKRTNSKCPSFLYVLVRREQKTSQLGSYLYCGDEHNKYTGLCISSSLLRGKQSISSMSYWKHQQFMLSVFTMKRTPYLNSSSCYVLKTPDLIRCRKHHQETCFLVFAFIFYFVLEKKKPFVPLARELWALLDEVPWKHKSGSFCTSHDFKIASDLTSNNLLQISSQNKADTVGEWLADCTCEMITLHSNLALSPFSSGFTNHLILNGSLLLFITLHPHQFSLHSTASLSLFVVKNITTSGSDVCHKSQK